MSFKIIFMILKILILIEVIDLYKEYGINIIDREKPFTKFIDYNKESFPNFQNGEFYILRNCVLGNFSFYSSYLQKDYKLLQEKRRNFQNII